MSRRYFTTGTDTEMGRIVTSCALLQTVKVTGYRTAGYEPVAPDDKGAPEGLRNNGALALQCNSSLQLDYATVNPCTLAEPTSPHIINAQKGRPIESLVMSAGLRALEQQADWVPVGGVGGWFTPPSDTFIFVNWVTQEQPSVILVVGVKFGCINHTVLTAQVIQHTGLILAGWVANGVTPPGKCHAEYMVMFIHTIPAPLLGEIPWLAEDPENAVTGKYVNPALL